MKPNALCGSLLLAAGLLLASGCDEARNVFDPAALTGADRAAVMPGVGAPGSDGRGAGVMEASVVITSLAKLKHFDMEGPGRMRKALASGAAVGPAEAHARQAAITRDLGIDLLVLPDVTDYRFTKESKSQSFYVGSNTWTETTYWAGVALRIVKPADGRVVYFARGEAKSKEGYAPAVQQATDKALAALTKLLAEYKAAQAAKQ